MLYFAKGSPDLKMTTDDLRDALFSVFAQIGPKNKVLALPPDITRFHSRAGELTGLAYKFYGDKMTDIMPALGTHSPMTSAEIARMFPAVPEGLFREHDWRNSVVTLGHVPAAFVAEETNGAVNFDWPAQVDRLLVEGGFDLILSLGQVVPHEVIGMANFNKNVFVGTGGPQGINKSHFAGAAYGMERIMGRADNPVRRILNYASEHFARHLPIVYIHTVISADAQGALQTRGLFIGDDQECFERAAELSLQVNFNMLKHELHKVIVYLDPSEFKSTWLGNKSIYRTRMALADDAELIVLAPGLREFGEDREIDRLIRKYGYVGTPRVMEAINNNKELADNLSAAAHLIHGSSEGRFKVTYCPGHLTREEIESVNFSYAPLAEMMTRYPPAVLNDGMNILPDGEEIFYISNPALGLWAYEGRFA